MKYIKVSLSNTTSFLLETFICFIVLRDNFPKEEPKIKETINSASMVLI
jgi:hypothetical protein